MTNYPAQIDDYQSLPPAIDNVTPVYGKVVNNLLDTIIAIESALGINPASTYTSVSSRFDNIENILNNLTVISLATDLGGTPNNPMVIGIQGRPVSNVPPTLNQVYMWNGSAWLPTSLGNFVGPTGPQGPAGPSPMWQITNVNSSSVIIYSNYTMFAISPSSGGIILTINDTGVTAGTNMIFKDVAGLAASNNITLRFSNLIDGAVQFTMNKNYQSTKVIFNGTQWSII